MLALFGFCMAWNYDSPWYVWLIGFICLLLDNRK
jgi:hypothetical protein